MVGVQEMKATFLALIAMSRRKIIELPSILKKANGDCECDNLMHNNYEVKYKLASLVYQCLSCSGD